MTILRTALWLGLAATTTCPAADEPRPAITLRLDEPDRQVRAVIDLFRGSRAAHPAAALAAWKRASREPGRLGKPLEAVIAAFNPAMADELKLLGGADLALRFDPASGRLAWGASLPGDDGSFAALATAFVLSGGAEEPPLDRLAVDRLGPPGSALSAQGPHALLLAGSREALEEALRRSDRPRGADDDPRHLTRFGVEPGAFDGAKSLVLQRLQAALRSARGPISGKAGLTPEAFVAQLKIGLDRPLDRVAVRPEWLEWLATDRAIAAFAVAIGPSPANCEAAFRLADAVERVDPARENLAPLRLRLDLLARTLGVRIDGEILPHLEGVAGWLGGDGRSADRACLMLHFDDEDSARRVFERIKPPPKPGQPPVPEAGTPRWMGRVEGRDLRLARFGRVLVATWGDGVLEAAFDARDHPDRSVAPLFRGRMVAPIPSFVAAAWPARVPGLLPAGSPLVQALAEGLPIIGVGSLGEPSTFEFEGIYQGLDAVIRRFLELIPLDPPPDH